MAITSWPDDVAMHAGLECVICGAQRSMEQVTAGAEDRHGVQRFACATHVGSSSEYVVGWADFLAAEEEEALSAADGWPLERDE